LANLNSTTRGGGWPSDSISRDILYAEYSLKLSDPYWQITDVGEPGEDLKCAVGIRVAPVISVKWTTARLSSGDRMHLDAKKCKNNHHCGIAQQRALSAMQLELARRSRSSLARLPHL
jgi:hypothetical protein